MVSWVQGYPKVEVIVTDRSLPCMAQYPWSSAMRTVEVATGPIQNVLLVGQKASAPRCQKNLDDQNNET